MKYVIEEGNTNSIKCFGVNNQVSITIDDFSNFINMNNKDLIRYILRKDDYVKLFGFSSSTFKFLVDSIFSDEKIDDLFDSATDEKKPVFSILYGIVKKYQRDYKFLCNIDKSDGICIVVNKNNFIKSLAFAKKYNCPIVISGTDISLLEYNDIFKNIDINEYKDFDIKVFYQERNSSLSLNELYDTASHVTKIVSDVKKYNLSPVEQIMYVYDFVKSREYNKEEDGDVLVSRDLNKVLTGEKIVCVGYSNLFTAILKCLNINSMPLISSIKKHQSNLVYIDDKKYNINGVYAFDATGDSKRNDFYINNYNYFAIPLDIYNKEIPFELYKMITLSFKELYNVFDYNNFSNADNQKLYYLTSLFELVNSNLLEDDRLCYDSSQLNDNVIDIYNTLLGKFYKDNIEIEKFFQIMYNVRRIEYYTGVISDLDMSDVQCATVHRAVIQRKKELIYDKDKSASEKILEMLSLDEELMNGFDKKGEDIIISSLSYNTNLDRDKYNIKLLKTLKNIKK